MSSHPGGGVVTWSHQVPGRGGHLVTPNAGAGWRGGGVVTPQAAINIINLLTSLLDPSTDCS